jgi:membrane-associated phospholipid phosphatase
MWWTRLTEFGNPAITLPLAVVTFVWLLYRGAIRGAVWWAFAVVGCAGLTAVAKIAAYACPPLSDLHSPSGHTSLSALVYGAIGLIIGSEDNVLQRTIIVVVVSGFISGIAISRIILGMHSVLEVLVGLAIGIAALAGFAERYLRFRPDSAQPVLYGLVAAALVLISYGGDLRPENSLHWISRYFHLHCP